MARNFLSYPFAPYIGGYSAKPFNSGRGMQKGLMVALEIPWATYQANGASLGTLNPNFTVDANLNGAGPNSVSQLWNIESVYIDNEGVDFPVYVYFTDSLFTVSCPANSAGWYQVFTNARHALISGVGISDAAITQAQRTRLFFTDVMMVPSLDQEAPSSTDLWIGSKTIQRPSSLQQLSGLGSPALGDQVLITSLNMPGGSANVPIGAFGPFPAPLFIYFTQIQIVLSEFVNSGVAAQTLAKLTGSVDGDVFFVTANGGVTSSLNAGSPNIIGDLRGNLRFKAQQSWLLQMSLSVNCTVGTQDWRFVYSLSDK